MTSYYPIGVTQGGFGLAIANLLVSFNLTGNNPTEAVNVQLTNPQSPCVPQVLSLSSGDNTINATTCPALTTAGGVIIIPPASNSNTIKLKGITADTGIILAPAVPFGPWVFPPPPGNPPTSFVLNASNQTTIDLIWF